MKKVFYITVFCYSVLFLLAPASAMDALSSPWEGYYVGKTDQTGRAQKIIEVDVFTAHEGETMYIDFMVAGDPPGHTLGAVGEVFNEKRKQFHFVFKDEHGNKGRGLFSRHGKKYVLHIELPRRSSKGVVAGYSTSDYEVIKQGPKARTDRHPWSVSRVRDVPAILEGH